MGMVWEACGKGVPLLGVPGELPTTISMIRSRHEKGFKIMNPLSHMWTFPIKGHIFSRPPASYEGLKIIVLLRFNHLDQSSFTYVHLRIYLHQSIYLPIHPSSPCKKQNPTHPYPPLDHSMVPQCASAEPGSKITMFEVPQPKALQATMERL